MSDIVLLGAGVMASALAVPAAAHPSNTVTLVGSPLDDDIVRELAATGRHPTLDAELPRAIRPLANDELDEATLARADVVVIGVSSPGVGWAVRRLEAAGARPSVLALVTKGLVPDEDAPSAPPLTYADALPAALCSTPDGIVGIGGPCIARELALGYPTRVTFASRHRPNAERLRTLLQGDTYRVTVDDDIVGVEACAALKNFLCIGISAMFTAHRLGDSHAKNPLAALYNQGVLELAALADWLRESSPGSARDTLPPTDPPADPPTGPSPGTPRAAPSAAFDLAGMGDLHVTVGGGRNSRLGRHLGDGETLAATLDGPMKGVTVEGVDTGRALSRGFVAACEGGRLDAGRLPLTRAILACIDEDRPFALDFRDLPG